MARNYVDIHIGHKKEKMKMMKKLVVLIALAMCLSFACAEQNLVVSFEHSASWIGNSNLLGVRGENAYYIADLSGNKLTDEIYSAHFTYNEGLITAQLLYGDRLNCCGVVDSEGNEVVPFEYGDIDMYEGKWVVAVKLKEATHEQYDYSTWTTDDVYLIETVDIYNLKTDAVMSLSREHYERSQAYDSVINIEDRSTGKIIAYDENLNPTGEVTGIYYVESNVEKLDVFYENNKYGVKKGDRIIVDPCYDSYLNFNYGYACVKQKGKYGLIDENGVKILPAAYDEILLNYSLPVTEGETGYSSKGYYAVIVDGKLGYATTEGITCEAKYPKANVQNNGASALYTDPEGYKSIVAADGAVTPLDEYMNIYCLDFSGGYIYKVSDKNGKWGLIDWHGNEIFPCLYSSFALSGDGQYVVVSAGYNKYEVYGMDFFYENLSEKYKKEEDVSVNSLISDARKLMRRDPAAAVELIDDAIELFASGNSAVNLLQGAKELIKTDAVAYEDAISLLLNGVVEKFK